MSVKWTHSWVFFALGIAVALGAVILTSAFFPFSKPQQTKSFDPKEFEAVLARLAEGIEKRFEKRLADEVARGKVSTSDRDRMIAEMKKLPGIVAQIRKDTEAQLTKIAEKERLERKLGNETNAKKLEQIRTDYEKGLEGISNEIANLTKKEPERDKQSESPTPAPVLPQVQTSDTSAEGNAIAKNAARIGLVVLCIWQPELAPLFILIASELDLLGNDAEVERVVLDTVRTVSEGKPLSEEQRNLLLKHAKNKKFNRKILDHIIELNETVARTATPNKPAVPNKVNEDVLKEAKKHTDPPKPNSKLVKDIEEKLVSIDKAMKENSDKLSLDDLREVFPGFDPNYPTQADKDAVKQLFAVRFKHLAAEYWDGPKGLGSIPVDK